MPQILDFATSTALSRILAGPVTMNQNDGVEIDTAGLAYSIQFTDTAARNAVGTVFADVNLNAVAQPDFTISGSRLNFIKHSVTGDFFYLIANGTQQGLKVSRYSGAGTLLGSFIVDATATICVDPQIGQLPNGNIVVSYIISNVLNFIILSPSLGQVVALTAVDTVNGAGPPTATFSLGITTTGFCFTYVLTATANHRLVIYNQDGSVAVASFTVMTWTGAAGNVFSTVRQQSDGNLFIGFGSKYATTIGTYCGIFSVAGAVIKVVTQLDPTTVTNGVVEVAVQAGFVGLSTNRAANNKVWVFNSAGAQQGITYTHATTSAIFSGAKLVADSNNSRFLLIDMVNGTAVLVVSAITTAGVNSVISTAVTTSATTGVAIDAVVDRSRLVILHTTQVASAVNQCRYAVLNLITGLLDSNNVAIGPTVTTASATLVAIIASGDFSFASLISIADSTDPAFKDTASCQKYVATAIIGSLFTAIAANAQGYARSGPGTFNINKVGGTAAIAFDDSATTPHGNKGTVSNNNLSLVGMT